MILQSARDYLNSTSSVRIAHLVEIELAGAANTFSYGTDYLANITVGGKTYEAGRIMSVGSVRLTQGLTSYNVNVVVPGEYQEELDKATTDLSYEGKRLNIYRVFIKEDGSLLQIDDATGGPLVWFQGRITSIALADNITSGASKVTFSCAGLLSDFEKVNGRITDDRAHRGLVSSALGEVPSAGAKRVEYQTDLGFQHANQTISTNIQYLAKEKEYYLKKSWGGLKSKLREREVEVERELDLKTSLEAKYLPVIYGVRKVQGIPVFLDVLKSDPSKMYCVYAFCEGEITSFINVYVNGVSAICGPGAGSQDTALCMGNMESGDTLGVYNYPPRQEELAFQMIRTEFMVPDADYLVPYTSYTNIAPSTPSNGTTHGQIINVLADEGPIEMQFFHGKSDQVPAQTLVNIAAFNNFLVQNTTKKPDGTSWGSDYWPGKSGSSSGAALLDTAYIIATFNISDDRTTLPEIEAVVSGIPCRVYTTPTSFTVQKTLNPVWHLLHYLTNDRFGGGLNISDLDIKSFIATAQKLDVQDTGYETSFVTMWKYLGWESKSGTRSLMQCNTLLHTEEAVTKLVESVLGQFNGTLSTIQGKYVLSVESDDAVKANITMDDVVGQVRLNTKANKDKWNSMQASIQDPGQGWSSNQVTFFDSTYLAEDNGIRKQGRATFEHVTNYYTARAWAQFLLNKSRFSKKVSITTYYKFFELQPNDNITFTYAKYGFTAPNNKFRVVEVEPQPDGLINLTLERYDSSIFQVGQQSKVPLVPPAGPAVAAPVNLQFTLLPSTNVLLSVPEGFLGGVAHWNVPADVGSLLRWDVFVYREEAGTLVDYLGFSVPTTERASILGTDKPYVLIPMVPNTPYQIKVQAINKYGNRSPFSIRNYTSGLVIPPAVVPTVKNFRSSNTLSTGEFTGPDVLMSWDAVNPDLVQGLELEIQKTNPIESLVTLSIPVGSTSYTFTLQENKGYYSVTTGGVGAYRAISARVRAFYGTNYSKWSELNYGNN